MLTANRLLPPRDHRLTVEHVWNVMAHARKPDFVFRRNGRVHLHRRVGEFSRLLAAEVCVWAVVMLDTPCSEVQCKTTGYPLHWHVSPSLLLSCVTVCHQVSTELCIKSSSPTFNTMKEHNQVQSHNCTILFCKFPGISLTRTVVKLEMVYLDFHQYLHTNLW